MYPEKWNNNKILLYLNVIIINSNWLQKKKKKQPFVSLKKS